MPEALCCSIFCALLPDHSYLVEKLSVPDLIEVAVAEPSKYLQSRIEEFDKLGLPAKTQDIQTSTDISSQ